MIGELDVEDEGLSGMVALMKMRESRLRCCRAEARVCGDASEYGGGGSECERDSSDAKVVSMGESIWRFARGEAGRPTKGESGEDIAK